MNERRVISLLRANYTLRRVENEDILVICMFIIFGHVGFHVIIRLRAQEIILNSNPAFETFSITHSWRHQGLSLYFIHSVPFSIMLPFERTNSREVIDECQTILTNYTWSTTNRQQVDELQIQRKEKKMTNNLGNSEFGTDVEPAGNEWKGERERVTGNLSCNLWT